MWDEQEIEWNVEHWWIRCSGHIINLAVQAFLFANFHQRFGKWLKFKRFAIMSNSSVS